MLELFCAVEENLDTASKLKTDDANIPSLLFDSITANKPACTKLFLSKGANVNAIYKTNTGILFTPLDAAIVYGKDDYRIRDLLVREGAQCLLYEYAQACIYAKARIIVKEHFNALNTFAVDNRPFKATAFFS